MKKEETNYLSDSEILNFLQYRKELLLEEIRKIDATMTVISSSSALLNQKPIFYKSSKKKNRANNTLTRETTSTAERKHLKGLDDLIIHSLEELKEADRYEIGDFIASKEGDIDLEKLKRNLSVRLSVLLKEDKINGIREGRRYKYSV